MSDDGKSKEINEVVGRMGNNMVLLMAAGRNLGEDYGKLTSLLEMATGISKDKMTISDRLILEHRDKDGNLMARRDSGWSPNGITNAGFAEVAGLLLTDVGGTDFDYVAIGTGTTAFDPAQTALVTETKRKAGTGTRVTTIVANDTAQLQVTFAAADTLSGTDAITESGGFNAAAAGTMLCRQTFAALNLNWDAGDSLQVTWKVQVKQGT
jgi:hypothetical protein